MNSFKAIVSEKGQVTIPQKIRQQLGLKSGQVLEFKAYQGKLIAHKKAQTDSLNNVVGLLKDKRINVDAYLDEVRGKK